jgi:hypothetical protein
MSGTPEDEGFFDEQQLRGLLEQEEGQERHGGIHRPSVRGGLPKRSTDGFLDLFTVKKKDKGAKKNNAG